MAQSGHREISESGYLSLFLHKATEGLRAELVAVHLGMLKALLVLGISQRCTFAVLSDSDY